MVCTLPRLAGSFVAGRAGPTRARRMVAANAETVFVTGATGKTGKLIAQKIQESDDFELRALTRTEKVLPYPLFFWLRGSCWKLGEKSSFAVYVPCA